MKARKYLTIDCDGKNARITSRPVQTEAFQMTMELNITIPDEYFQRPTLRANLDVPPNPNLPNDANVICDDVAKALADANIKASVVIEAPTQDAQDAQQAQS